MRYGGALRPGRDLAEVLFGERLREDALRAEGLGAVRRVGADLDHVAPVAARLRRTFR